MRVSWMKTTSLIMLCLLLVGSIAGAGVYAQGVGVKKGDDVVKLRLRAELLQNLLVRILTVANVSDTLRVKAENLISANVSAMSIDELKSFIEKARKIFSEIKESLREEMMLMEGNLTARLLEKIEERLNITLQRLNITEDEAEKIRKRIREKLRERLTIRGLGKLMREIRGRLAHHRAMRFCEQVMNFTERAAKSGELHGLNIALKATSKVLSILERVRERLERVNASQAAVAAVEHAIEKITLARKILEEVVERVHHRRPGSATIPENATKPENAANRAKEILKERLIKAIDSCLDKLRKLKAKAEKLGLTWLVDKIDQAISKLENLRSKVVSGNADVDEAATILAAIKHFIKHVEEILEEMPEGRHGGGPHGWRGSRGGR